MSLDELKKGQSAIIKTIHLEPMIKNRLIQLGLFVGSKIELERHAPSGDPQAFIVSGNMIALRKVDSARIEIEQVKINE